MNSLHSSFSRPSPVSRPKRSVTIQTPLTPRSPLPRTPRTPKKKVRRDEQVPGVLPFFLLGAAAVCSLAMPTYLMLTGGMPEPSQDFKPPKHGIDSEHPTQAVAHNPREGEHFTAGELLKEGRALGHPQCRNSVVEFTDFFCPHCQEAHEHVMHPLLERYLPVGRVRIESHPVAFLDDESLRAAHAAICAQEQHKYWEVRELLFQVNLETKDEESDTVFSPALLNRIAHMAGLDKISFAKCFHSKRHVDEIKRISKVARKLGVVATPTFFVNNKHEEGLVSLERLAELLGPPAPPAAPDPSPEEEDL